MNRLLLVILIVGALPFWGCSSSKTNDATDSGPSDDEGGVAEASTVDVQQGEAGTRSWSQVGLDGSIISSIAVDATTPARAYLGVSAGSADKGFFRTEDAGKTWSKVGGGLPDEYAGVVAVHAQLGTVLANPGVSGLWRSTDGGATWTAGSGDVPGGVTTILFHPTANTAWSMTSQQGTYRSADGGITWGKTLNTGLPLNQFGLGPLAFDGTTLYLATDDHGVYTSSDSGDSWTHATSTGLATSGAEGLILNIQATPSRPGVLFVQTETGGVFRSPDGGANFTKLDTSPEATRYSALRIDPSSATTVYVSVNENQSGSGGLLRTTDDGQVWTPIGPGTSPNDTLPVNAVDVAPDGTIYAGTIGKGIWHFGL